jgi:hypothetical protein
VRPFTMAERFINCTETKELEKMRKFACDVCDFAPHLLDNDNVSLLVVLLILSRSDCCRRFENNGIRIEGSTISHRKAECMKNKMGWKTPEEKKPYDNFANEFQVRVKNACFPAPRAQRVSNKKPPRKSSGPGTPTTPNMYSPMTHMSHQVRPSENPYGIHNSINVPLPSIKDIYPGPSAPSFSRASTGAGSNMAEPMDLSSFCTYFLFFLNSSHVRGVLSTTLVLFSIHSKAMVRKWCLVHGVVSFSGFGPYEVVVRIDTRHSRAYNTILMKQFKYPLQSSAMQLCSAECFSVCLPPLRTVSFSSKYYSLDTLFPRTC